MNWTQTFLSAVIAAMILGTIVIGAAWYWGGRSDIGAFAAGRSHSWHGGMHRGARGHGMSAWCDRDDGHKTAMWTPFVEAELGLTGAQRTQWTAFAAKLDQAMTSIRTPLCSMREAASAPDKLAAAGGALTKVAGELEALQPEFASFYAALDAKQREILDAALSRHGGRH